MLNNLLLSNKKERENTPSDDAQSPTADYESTSSSPLGLNDS